MVDVYDRELTATLLKEGREISAGLKIELPLIATQMTRVLDGDDVVEIRAEAAHALEKAQRPSAPIPVVARDQSAGRSFWQFWR